MLKFVIVFVSLLGFVVSAIAASTFTPAQVESVITVIESYGVDSVVVGNVRNYLSGLTVPTVSLIANPSSINAGQSSTLAWSSTDADSCVSDGFVSTGTSGSVPVSPLVTTVYGIACTGPGGRASGSATVSVMSTPNIVLLGETTVFTGDDSGNGSVLTVQNATLAQAGIINSMSFYVRAAAGSIRLGIYDATGPNGGPGALKAHTASFMPVTGWNTRNVSAPVRLPAGAYWLAYFPSSNNLHFSTEPMLGVYRLARRSYSSMPSRFPAVTGQGSAHWSLYATIATDDGGVPSDEVRFTAYITGYTWFDNTPPGSADISDPIIHSVAAGVGTYADPITMAVGHVISGGIDTLDYPAGTKFYIPNYRRYFLVEDTCGDGPTPQDGPCHVNTDVPGYPWLDIWLGGQWGTASDADSCANAITDLHLVIKNPASNYAVVSGSVYSPPCTQQYGDAVVTNSTP